MNICTLNFFSDAGKSKDAEDGKGRPTLSHSNSGADIMLGLETDDGATAEVEIDSLETDELQPEGNVLLRQPVCLPA